MYRIKIKWLNGQISVEVFKTLWGANDYMRYLASQMWVGNVKDYELLPQLNYWNTTL